MSRGDAELQEIVELWDQLSDGSHAHVVAVVRSLAANFTGTIRLECSQGGVGGHYQTAEIKARNVQPGREG